MKKITLSILKEELNPRNGYSVDDLIGRMVDFYGIPVHVFGGGEDEFDDVFREVVYHPIFIPKSWWGGALPRMVQWGGKDWVIIENMTGKEVVTVPAEYIEMQS